jgi:Zn-dependent peptidase ImmA (M78 family)
MGDDLKSTFSRRLRQARTIRALSLRGLVDTLDGVVSHNALAKYENGEMMPGSGLLGRLADVLGQPPDFFFRPFSLSLKEIRFRKRVRLGAKAEAAVKAEALEYFERYHAVEELLGDTRTFEGKLRMPPLAQPAEAEAAADTLRDEWQLGRDALPNVVELVESRGIKVYEVGGDLDAFDGFSADTEAGPVMVVSKGLNPLRKRMTLVHELAHIVLPTGESLSEKDEEAIVSRFAGAFLLPKGTFEAEFGRIRRNISLAELIELKVNYGASIWAIMVRARQLELISEAVFLRFCKEAAPWRSAKKEPGDDQYRGNEAYSRFRQLVQRAIAEDQISLSKGAALLNQNLGDLRKELREMFS